MVIIKADSNNRKVELHIEKLRSTINTAIRKGFYLAGKKLQEVSKKGIKNPPKTGIVYKYKGRNKRSSSPGQYPANRSGDLRKSVDFQVRGHSKMFFGSLDNNIEYGKYLELGTGKMKPRPFLKNTIDKETRNIQNIFEEELKKAI